MRVAIIGCGTMGHLHASMAAACGLKIIACGDKHKHHAKILAEPYGAAASDDSMAVIADPEVDIVAICSPTPTHAGYAIAAAEAGKSIFCEKPFARTVQQCRQAMAAARKARVKLFVAHVVRYFQEFEAMRAQLAAGKVGKPGFVKLYRGGLFPMGVDGWFRDYEQSGGVTLDSMIHDIDWLRYTFGDAERVFCQALRRSEPEVIDYSMATFRMKSGVIAKVIGTWAQPGGFRVETEICGDKGMIQFNSDETPIFTMKRTAPGEAPSTIVPASPVPKSPYQLEWEEFLAWVRDTRQPRVTARDATEAVRMALAALESAETGKPVKL